MLIIIVSVNKIVLDMLHLSNLSIINVSIEQNIPAIYYIFTLV